MNNQLLTSCRLLLQRKMFGIVTPKHFFTLLLMCLSITISAQVPTIPGTVFPSGKQFRIVNENGSTSPYYFSGTNNYYMMYKPMEMNEDVLNDMVQLNQKVVRMWFFMDGQSHDGFVFQSAPGVYHEASMQHMDQIIAAMGARGLKALPVFINYWSDFGGMAQYAAWAGTTAGNFFADPTCKQIYKDYISMWANRVNTVTGVQYKNDPTIFAWQLTNEGRAQSGKVNEYVAWVREMSDFLRAEDPNHMISVGDEGLFNYTYDQIAEINATLTDYQITNDWTYSGGMSDWEAYLEMPNISFGTIHNYATDNWGYDVEWGEDWTKYHVEVADSYNKPCIMEEYDKAYKGVWNEQEDLDRANVIRRYQNIIQEYNMAGDCSWMLVGRNFTDPVPAGYTMDVTAPVEEIWLYRVKWPGDGHQYSRYDPHTGPALKEHADFMWAKNGVASSTLDPIASAGGSQLILDYDLNGEESVNLSAAGSIDPDGGDIVSYEWQQNGTTISTGISVSLSLTTGEHPITLMVTDDEGETGTATVTITIGDPRDYGCCGMDVTVGGQTYSYCCNPSSDDPDNDGWGWNGAQSCIVAGSDADPENCGPIDGHNQAPIANAGADFTVNDPDGNGTVTVTLNGAASNDPDGTITNYMWVEDGIQLGTGANPTVELIGFKDHRIFLTVTDNEGLSGTDEIIVTVETGGATNIAPSASAGNDQTVGVALGTAASITLDASASNDPDGSIVSYQWVENGVVLSTETTPTLFFEAGTHTVNLVVTDNEGAMDNDEVIITVTTIEEPSDNIALSKPATASSVDGFAGNAATAVDGDNSTRWASEWSDPQWIYIDLENSYNLESITLVWETAYSDQYEIQVSDDANNWSTIYNNNNGTGGTEIISIAGTGRYVRVYANSRATQWGVSLYEIAVYGSLNDGTSNVAPIANAGSDIVVQDNDRSGAESVSLNGSASSDADGTITNYSWSENGIEIASGANTSVSFSVGEHQVTLTVTDNNGASHSTTIDVTVEEGVIIVVPTNTYEAEDATLEDATIETGLNATADAYAYLKGTGSITWNVTVETAGSYDLIIRYMVPFGEKRQYLNVNGNFIGDILYAGANNTWLEEVVTVDLTAGNNEVMITKSWGWMYFDNLSVSSSNARIARSNEAFSTANEMSLYPNPVENEIHLSIPSFFSDAAIFQVIDLKGQVIMERSLSLERGANNFKFRLPDNAQNGMHLFRVSGENISETGKILIQK